MACLHSKFPFYFHIIITSLWSKLADKKKGKFMFAQQAN